MLISTLVPAVFLVGIVYFFVIKLLRWRWLSYGLALLIGGLLAAAHAVHFVFTGIEVAGLGCLITKIDHMGYWRSNIG